MRAAALQAAGSLAGLSSGGPRLGTRQRPVAILLVAALAALLSTQSSDLARGLVGVCALTVFVVVALSGRTLALTLIVVWLVLVGFVRRFLIPFAGWSENDPLLLVAPAAAIIFLISMRGEPGPPRGVLTSIALFQVLWSTAQVLNPNEPSPVVAAQGALFFVVPYLWFLVGRRLTTDQHDRVLRTLWWMLIPVLALGLYHSFVGLLPFELTWLGVSDTSPALVFVGGFHIRPFSTLTSPQEYGLLLALGGLLTWTLILYRDPRRRYLIPMLGLIVVALFLQGSRGIFASFIVAFIVMGLVKLRSGAVAFAVVSGVVALVLLISQGLDFSPPTQAEQEEQSTVTAIVQHQFEGLLNPSSSTLPLHIELWTRGFSEGFSNPLGLGPSRNRIVTEGVGSPVADTGEDVGSPENELSITAAALGLPGAVALVAFYVAAAIAVVRLNRWRPSARHLAWLGMVLVVGDQALNGRLYVTSMIVAVVLGGIARDYAQMRAEQRRPATAISGPVLVGAPPHGDESAPAPVTS